MECNWLYRFNRMRSGNIPSANGSWAPKSSSVTDQLQCQLMAMWGGPPLNCKTTKCATSFLTEILFTYIILININSYGSRMVLLQHLHFLLFFFTDPGPWPPWNGKWGGRRPRVYGRWRQQGHGLPWLKGGNQGAQHFMRPTVPSQSARAW